MLRVRDAGVQPFDEAHDVCEMRAVVGDGERTVVLSAGERAVGVRLREVHERPKLAPRRRRDVTPQQRVDQRRLSGTGNPLEDERVESLHGVRREVERAIRAGLMGDDGLEPPTFTL